MQADLTTGSRTLLFGLALVVALAFVPLGTSRFLDVGLDPSYRAVLQHVVGQDLQFGRDIIFNYGPLGFLQTRSYSPATGPWVLAWSLLFATTLAGAFLRLTRGDGLALSLGKLGALVLLCCLLPSPDSWLLLLAALVLLTDEQPGGLASQLLLAVVLGVAALMKSVHLAASVGVVGVTLVRDLAHRRVPTVPLAWLFTVFAGLLATGQEWASLPAFVAHSLEISRGYVDVLARTGPAWQLVSTGVAALALAVVLPGALRSAGRSPRWERGLALGGLTVLFLIAFKLGFVRHTQRVVISSGWLASVATIVWLGSLTPPRARRQLALATVAVAVCLVNHAALLQRQGQSVQTFLGTPARNLAALVEASHGFPIYRREHEQAAERIRQAFPLPAIAGPVDLIGNRVAIPIAHGLDYAPRPVFQSFSAYTPVLARLNGAHLGGEAAPPTLLVDDKPFEDFPLSLLDAEAFLELFQSYTLRERAGELLVLERSTRRPFRRVSCLETSLALGDTLALDAFSANGPLWVELAPSATLVGQLAEALLKLPPLQLELEFASGPPRSYRLAPAAASGGFLLSPLLVSNDDIAACLREGLGGDDPTTTVTVTALRVTEGGDFGDLLRDGLTARVFWLER